MLSRPASDQVSDVLDVCIVVQVVVNQLVSPGAASVGAGVVVWVGVSDVVGAGV